jgi:potassium-dependent mechanosensitive channel
MNTDAKSPADRSSRGRLNIPLPGLAWLTHPVLKWLRGDIIAGIMLAAFLLPSGVAAAQVQMAAAKVSAVSPLAASLEINPAAGLSGADTSTKSLAARLAEARANLAAADAIGEAALTNAPTGIPLQDIAARRALLQRLCRLLEQQLSNVSELESAKDRRQELTRAAQAWTRFTELPPYSILLTDRLREEIEAERLKTTSGETAVSTIDRLIGENRAALTLAEGNIRQLNEQLEGPKDPVATVLLSWQRNLEQLRSQVAAASVGVLDSERQLRHEALAESRIRLGWLQRQLVSAEADSKFTQADLDRVMARIEGDRQQLERELTEVQARWHTARQAAEVARQDLRRIQALPDASPAATDRATEALAAREAQCETAQSAIRMLRLMLETENVERTMWEMRFAAYHSRSVETLSESERRLEDFTRRSRLWKDYQQQQMEVSPSQIELQETRVRNLAPDSDLLPLARERLAALHERDQLLLRLVRRMEQMQRLSQRWAEGLRFAEGRLPFLGRVQNLFSNAGSFLKKFWSFELFTAEDTITVEGQLITGKRSVTLGKVVMAVLILGLGIWITGLVSRVAEPIIIRRLKIEANQANLIRRWFRAFMVVCLIMFSLVSVKIPLTVFAFAGGALAIGLGFGLQNLLKNFVSGLIILFERPFRVGDVLDVGGQRGTVAGVGLRASILQLWDGTETLIPNSTLLENNLTNWTYSNRKVRFTVTVGVAYGSDPRRVSQVLHEVAERHGLVEKEPKPQVLFTEFGDSALSFELRFWVDVTVANAAQVSSDLRQMIAGSFAEQGIVIAFPQRDIHLFTSRPIPVEVVPAARVSVPAGQSPFPATAGPKTDKTQGTAGIP